MIYLQPGGDSIAYLKELRLQNTEELNKDLLIKQSRSFNSPKLQNAVKGIFQLISDESIEFEDL